MLVDHDDPKLRVQVVKIRTAPEYAAERVVRSEVAGYVIRRLGLAPLRGGRPSQLRHIEASRLEPRGEPCPSQDHAGEQHRAKPKSPARHAPTGSSRRPRTPPQKANASSQVATSQAPSSTFISPPGALKPVDPKIVVVSTACSAKTTSPRMPSHRGRPPRCESASRVTGAIIVIVAPVRTGPQKIATSSTVRAVPGSSQRGWSARPPHDHA